MATHHRKYAVDSRASTRTGPRRSYSDTLRTALVACVGLILAFLPLSPATAGVVSLCSGFDGCNSAGRSSFGWQDVYTQSFWGQVAGHNCTNYVAYRLQQRDAAKPVAGAMGNAENWGHLLAGITNSTPTVGSIAWWNSSAGLGELGHVAYVQEVHADGVVVSEDSYPGGPFRWRKYTPGYQYPTGFIHIKDETTPDRDGDGTPDASDRCPDQAGPASTGGCPDTDGDAVADADDSCPRFVGPSGTGGCPPEEYDSTAQSDFNGDGRTDVAAFYDYGGGRTKGWIFPGTPDGLSKQSTVFWDSGNGNWETNRTRFVGGDFNGDGRTDVAAFYDYGGGRTKGWIFPGTPDGLSKQSTVFWDSGNGNWETNRTRFVGGDAMAVRMRNNAAPAITGEPVVGGQLANLSSGGNWRPHQGPGAPKGPIPSSGWQTGRQLGVRMVPRTFSQQESGRSKSRCV